MSPRIPSLLFLSVSLGPHMYGLWAAADGESDSARPSGNSPCQRPRRARNAPEKCISRRIHNATLVRGPAAQRLSSPLLIASSLVHQSYSWSRLNLTASVLTRLLKEHNGMSELLAMLHSFHWKSDDGQDGAVMPLQLRVSPGRTGRSHTNVPSPSL